nr:MAG TPA: cell division protein kinase [Caudoviricetes sp.]DAW39454.1 MAG TPA: cell division protein kinase [Bacteriophage sp.]
MPLPRKRFILLILRKKSKSHFWDRCAFRS